MDQLISRWNKIESTQTQIKPKRLTKRQEAKLWKDKKRKNQPKKEVSEPSVKLFKKSNSGIYFTRGKQEKPEKQPSKKLNIVQKRNEKKERDVAIALKKQKNKANIKENALNKLDLFYAFIAKM